MTDWAAKLAERKTPKVDWAAKVAARKKPVDEPAGMSETAVRKFGQGASFGLTDEIGGVTGAIIDKAGFGDLYGNQTFLDRYKANRDQRRAELAKMQQDHPALSTGLELAGGLVSGIAAGGGAVARVAAKPTITTIAREGAKVGAQQGALGGFGYSDADTAAGVAVDTVKGAGIGAGIGAAVPVAAAGVGKAIQATANKSEGFTGALKTLTNHGVTALTKGQARGSDPTKMVETTLAQAPVVGGAVARRLRQGREQYQQALLKMVGLKDGTTLINVKTIDRLKSMFDDQYTKALTGKGVGLHEDEFMDKLAQFEVHYVDDIPDVNKANTVRVQIGRLLNDAVKSAEKGQITGKQYQQMRSKLGRMASNTTDPDIAKPLRDLKSMLDESFAAANGGDIADVNSRYHLFKDLEEVVNSNSAPDQVEGYISLRKLATVAKQSRNKEWRDLTDAAQVVLPDAIPNSATTQRRMALELMGLTTVGGAVGYLGSAADVARYGATGAAVAYGLSRGRIPGPVRAPLASYAAPAVLGPSLLETSQSKRTGR